MTDETKRIFDAPWKVDKVDFKSDIFGVGSTILRIFDKTEELITTHIPDEKTANRLARLPELYDALVKAVYEHCYNSCLVFIYAYAESVLEINMIENGCPRKNDGCEYCKVWELLKKVRDGE